MKTKEITLRLQFDRRQVKALLIVVFLAWHPAFLGSETLTLTTYYPAPYGGYVNLLTTGQTLLARDGGRVGINTGTAIAPRAPLDVRGEVVAMSRFTMTRDASSTSLTWHIDNDNSGRFRIFQQPNINTAGIERVTIRSDNGEVSLMNNLRMAASGASITGTNMSISGLCIWRNMIGTGWSNCAAGENLVNTNYSNWVAEWACIGRAVASATSNAPANACIAGTKVTGISGSMLCCRIQ
ncbi:MAG TPA: hypothetical protein DCS63_00820 [Elusimicrobia bacterium]|nr:hypothetical protein [Elusimicrobiota bacterium]